MLQDQPYLFRIPRPSTSDAVGQIIRYTDLNLEDQEVLVPAEQREIYIEQPIGNITVIPFDKNNYQGRSQTCEK